MAEVIFNLHEILTHKPLGRLEPRSFAFNDPIWGGGQCDLSIAIQRERRRASLI